MATIEVTWFSLRIFSHPKSNKEGIDVHSTKMSNITRTLEIFALRRIGSTAFSPPKK
jgi:hypothetical protein